MGAAGALVGCGAGVGEGEGDGEGEGEGEGVFSASTTLMLADACVMFSP